MEKLTVQKFNQFKKTFEEMKDTISACDTKEEAVEYLMKEAGLSEEECDEAYDFFMS